MSWLQKLLPPKIKRTPGAAKKAVPEGLWIKCDVCEAVLYRADLEKSLDVCPKCSHHNRISARLPFLARFLDIGPYPQAGTANTVKATTAAHGPSMRMDVDFSDFDRSVQNLTLGESGNFLSPFYKDQFDAWYHGSSFPMLFTRQAVEQGAVHRLALEPH